MGDPMMGRFASIKIGEVLVENMGRWTLNLTGTEIDVSAFGTEWERKVPGMQGWNATLEGNYDPVDDTGQKLLVAAKLEATKLTTLRLYLDDDTYWEIDTDENPINGCYIRNVDIVQDKAGVATVSIGVLGFGALRLAGAESF
jgi:hypothetical protein